MDEVIAMNERRIAPIVDECYNIIAPSLKENTNKNDIIKSIKICVYKGMILGNKNK